MNATSLFQPVVSRPLLGTWQRKVAVVLAATALLAASSWISIPLWPVPVTLQSLAVAAIAIALGRRLATAAVVGYLVEGACGLPVFAGGASGAHVLVGPTGGYLLGFVLTAIVIGGAADRGWTRGIVARAGAMLGAHAIILLAGCAWLSAFVGVKAALLVGLMPFLVGTGVKVAFGAAAPSMVSRLSSIASRSEG